MERGGYVATNYPKKVRETMAHVAVAMEKAGINRATRLEVVNAVLPGLPESTLHEYMRRVRHGEGLFKKDKLTGAKRAMTEQQERTMTGFVFWRDLQNDAPTYK